MQGPQLIARTRRFELWLDHSAESGAVVHKQLRTDRLPDERAAARLRREAATLGRLTHPATVRGIGLRDRDARPRVTMEWLPGETLASRLREVGTLPEAETLDLARRVAGALEAVHELGLAHGDVKPANIMLTPRGPVLFDFDLARAPGALKGRLGTRLFRAPEQARCEQVLPASDMWSLGAILYRCTTGKLPYAGPDLPQLTAERPAAPAGQLGELIHALLHPDPACRPDARSVTASLGT